MGDLPERYDERSQFTQTSRLELAPDETADSLEVLTTESEKVEADEEDEAAVRGNEGPGSDRETLDLNLGFLVCFPVGKTESNPDLGLGRNMRSGVHGCPTDAEIVEHDVLPRCRLLRMDLGGQAHRRARVHAFRLTGHKDSQSWLRLELRVIIPSPFRSERLQAISYGVHLRCARAASKNVQPPGSSTITIMMDEGGPMRRSTALAFALALAIPGVAGASGSPPMSTSPTETPTLTPEQKAVEYYNDGVAYRERADKLEKESAGETDAAKKAKLLEKSKRAHESSIKTFVKAVGNAPNMFQAWGGLGYAYRKTGNYPLALGAYDKALALQNGYTPAIEYRAEAYLGLNRLDDVKSAYMALFNADRPRADELTSAMEKWVEKRQADSGGVDPATIEEFGKWVAERKQLASQTSSLRDPNAPHW